MLWLKRIFYGLLIIVGLAVVGLMATGNSHILYGIGQTWLIGKKSPDINDMSHFSVSTIKADHPEPWPLHRKFNLLPMPGNRIASVDSFETTALLVFKNDSLLFEKYWDDYSEKTTSNSFSMAKSFTAMLIGKAIEEGYIKSLDQKVGDFIPEYNGGKDAALTIRHLMQMSSGIPFGESYASPFGYMAKAYYGRELQEETFKYHVDKDPGTVWAYEGGNTVLLGLIIRKATGRTPSQYFFEKFWSCLGAETDAHWNLDHENGIEKTFSGFYATARDFARIGKLYMHHGVWGNDTLLSPEFVQQCLSPVNIPDVNGENTTWYGLQWWMGKWEGKDFFSCRGLRGQYIICVPEDNLIVVRLGHAQSKERKDHMPPDMYLYLNVAHDITSQVID
jgi:CubicO group peptidase (beta-lactamase class C family)